MTLNIDPNQPLLFLEARDPDLQPQRVDLTYFKSSGKYYSGATVYVEPSTSLLKIWDLAEHLLNTGQLPGLAASLIGRPAEFTVLVNAPGHENEHPRLIYPRGAK